MAFEEDIVNYLYQNNIENVVATLGTALTIGQAKLIRKFAKNVIISYDSDQAGQNATLRAIDILLQADIKVKILNLKDCKDPDDFIKKYLPCRPFEQREGKVIGADPRQEFAGSPYDPESMGCYAPVIRRALQSVLTDWTERAGESAWHIEDLTGVPMDRICTEYLDRGRPVIFWACIDMKEPIAGPDWYLEDGGTVFSWVSNEHCMLLVGYYGKMYYFNDPWEHHGRIGYPKEVVEARHRAQYEMAVTAYHA